MTSEQIKIVNNIKFSIINAIDNIDSEQMWEMLKQAYEQKEKDHCEDCISRAQALHACFDEWNKDYKAIMKSIRQLPSVIPQPKTGHWIKQTDDYHDYYKCEQCGIAVGLDDIKNYCPNCGAEMEIENEKETC